MYNLYVSHKVSKVLFNEGKCFKLAFILLALNTLKYPFSKFIREIYNKSRLNGNDVSGFMLY